MSLIIPRRRLLAGAGAAALVTQPALVRAGMLLGGTSGGGGTPFALVQHATTVLTGAQSLIDVTMTGTTSGNLLTACLLWYLSSSSSSAVASNNGSSMAVATGAAVENTLVGATIWYGINAAGGSVTLEGSWGATTQQFPSLLVQEWSGNASSALDEGVGFGAVVTSSPTASIATNGTITQANSLVLSCVTPDVGEATSVGVNQTLIDLRASYQLTDSISTTITHTWNWGASQGNIALCIAAFKHA